VSLLALAASALADVERFAVLIGNNQGFERDRTLYFAETDVRKVQAVLTGSGGVAADHTQVLLGRSRNDVLRVFGAIRADIEAAKARKAQTVFYVYYSGHADAERLQLGSTWITWAELEVLLQRSSADVRVAFIDACQSGSMVREKGGSRAPSFVFEVSERLDSSGSVVITSSTEAEASQESDEVGGSYFTHFLTSALAGAADDDRDGRVTLGETYRYVYHETAMRTASSRSGTQHPSFAWELSGEGDIVISELDRSGAALVFPASNPGTFAVFDHSRRMFVGEVSVEAGDRKLAVPPGRYLVQRRYPTYLAVADLTLPKGTVATVDAGSFRRGEYEDDVAKGAIAAVKRRGDAPQVSARLAVGGRRFADPEVASELFPSQGELGLDVRFRWRSGGWLGADAFAASGQGELAIDGLSYGVPTRLSSATVGLGAGWSTRPAAFGAGAGLHLEGFSLTRSFPGQDVPEQSLASVAPGALAWLGWYPGRVELEAELRAHYLPWIVDGDDQGLAYGELLLSAGWRF
jgi:hypothetical protein